MVNKVEVPFNYPYMTGRELSNIEEAHRNGRLAGDGPFTKRCQDWLQANLKTPQALLTHSCTHALEMSALLADLKPGDEVIMPSFTFVSTANAYALRGAVPVFVDIRADTLNIDEKKISEAITKRTKAIVVVHYAGVACEMNEIMGLARQHNLLVIEDSAHAIMSTYYGQPLGSIGDLACLSFHETKNIISGEGGALLVNDSNFRTRAEVIREKGTDRSQFMRGEIDKYTWRDLGSSFLPGEIVAAFLWAQMESAAYITQSRLAVWEEYHEALQEFEDREWVLRPHVPKHCEHNAHCYFLISRSSLHRSRIIQLLREKGIQAIPHYVPLHNSEAGRRYGRAHGTMANTESTAGRLLRLPLWIGVDTQRVISALAQALQAC